MNKRIKYFDYYGCSDPERLRVNSPAADTKVDYIISVLNRIGYAVDHISHAPSSMNRFLSSSIEQQGINTIRYFASLPHNKSVLRIFNRWFIEIQFFLWCLFHIKQNEQVIVYHSLGYDSTFIRLKKLKKIHIIGDIEEIFQDVKQQKPALCKAEYRFIESCDSYMFPTHLLNERLNTKGKKYVLVHGVYLPEPSRHVKWYDNDVHVVYAGTFDPEKGGALAAVAATAFLPKGYHVHICGFGNDNDTMGIITAIDSINSKSEAIVTYDGLLSGEDFILFLQKCQIGLSTQNPDAAFNATSFPSKVLTYLANGLRVVSTRIPAVEQSGVGPCLIYYNEQTPEMIAEAIQDAWNSTIEDTISVLHRLDDQFEKGIINLLSI